MKIKLPTRKCLRCEHIWFLKKPSEPRVCPGCHSPYWDVPRKVNVKMNDKENMKNGRKQTKG